MLEMVARVVPELRPLLLAAVVTFSAAPALGACGDRQIALADFDEPTLRGYITATLPELQRYFKVTYSNICMDRQDFGAYVQGDTLVMGVSFIKAVGEFSLNHITAVLAHETAHRFQIVNHLIERLTKADPNRVKCIELHADFMAGAFMRWRARYMKVAAPDLALAFFKLGDSAVHDYSHHGLGPERYVAFAAGYQRLSDDVRINASRGMQYVSQAKCDPD
jgi:hypothetical protein